MAESVGTPPVSLDRSTMNVDGNFASQKADPVCGRGDQIVSKKKVATARKRKGFNKKDAVESTTSIGGDCSVHKEAAAVYDVMMEFDQFVQYHEMKKKNRGICEQSGFFFSQSRSSSSQEGNQQNQVEFVTDGAQIEQVEEEKYDAQLVVPKDVTTEKIRSNSVVSSGSPSSAMTVNTDAANGKSSCLRSKQKNAYSPEDVSLCSRSKQKNPDSIEDANLCSKSKQKNPDSAEDASLSSKNKEENGVSPEDATEQEQYASEKACVPSEDDVSYKDSDEELTENESKPEDYLFPTPDEMENTSTPEVGKVFCTLDEAVRFVNAYAHISGFGIKKGRNYKHRKITICCNKSRKSVSNVSGVRKRRSVVDRTNCQMQVTVSLQDGKWIITSQDLAHNHDLVCSPTLTKFFLSHRSMNEAEKLLSRLLQEHRVKPRKIMSIFRKVSGGKLGNITFDVKKLDNLKQEDREKRRNTDIEHTMEYIEKLQ